jgi:hypothetical protein
MKNKRSLYWTLILYEDSTTLNFNDKIDYIKKNYDYLYIKHDKDKDDKGNLKKIHYHIVLKFKNYKWLNSLSNELDISSNYFEPINSLKNMLCYLIHFNNEDKFHYSLDEVIGSNSLKNKLVSFINNDDKIEEDKIKIIFNFINSCDFFISYSMLVDFVLKNCLWAEFRRSSLVFFKLLEEHNKFLTESRKNGILN